MAECTSAGSCVPGSLQGPDPELLRLHEATQALAAGGPNSHPGVAALAAECWLLLRSTCRVEKCSTDQIGCGAVSVQLMTDIRASACRHSQEMYAIYLGCLVGLKQCGRSIWARGHAWLGELGEALTS
eukprot:scaffold80785_cov20-Tisochrysis_lutea.AAC.1